MGEIMHETRDDRVEAARTTPKAAQGREQAEPHEGRGGLRVTVRKGESSGLHRTASALRTFVPLLQKLLPLLDGNVASAAANLLAPRLLGPPAVDLSPLEASLMKLRGDVALVQDRNGQQDVALKRIDDQLETMKDAVERAAVERRELTEEVTKVRRNMFAFSLIGVALLVISIGLNVAFFLSLRGGFR